jgi:adenylate cyclase
VGRSEAVTFEELMTNSKLFRMRRVMRLIPSAPRCKMCNVPFRALGLVFRIAGFGPSRKNPNMCTSCFERAPLGGSELEIGVLFADVRGFTTLAETIPSDELARLLNRFYELATEVLLRHDAVVDKIVGDEVMGLFLPPLVREDPIDEMVAAAEALLRGVGFGTGEEPWLPLGVGVDFGPAFVGNVGREDVKDFTALGDVVNTAARLQGQARPGQLVLSERVYEGVVGRFPDAPHLELELKGKSAPVAAHVIDLGALVPAPT